MRRRTFLTMGLVALPLLAGDSVPAVLAAACAPASGPPDGTVYHVSPAGDDGNTGLDPGSAWRTISFVNAQLAAGSIAAGDTVLFEQGQTFFGKIRPESASGAPLTVGAYQGAAGPGARPVISSYKILNNRSGWLRQNARVWRIDLSAANVGVTHTGYDGDQGGADNIGFLKVDGVIHGRRVFSPGDLQQQWDFYCDGERLLVRSDRNPLTQASDIRAACDASCIELQDQLIVDGLRFEGSGGHGAQGSGSHVQIRNCEFAEIGGSVLSGRTRYGNGVEVWIRSADIVVERNVIHDVYDSALTMQGQAESDEDGWRDIRFLDNTVYRGNQSMEFWSGAQGHDATGFVDCVVQRNVCLFAGRSWSADVRPDGDTGVHLLTYGWELPADITVADNVFYEARSAYRYSEDRPVGLTLEDNVVLQRAGQPLQWGVPVTVEGAADWVAENGEDRGSRFVILPSDIALDVGSALRSVAALRPNPVDAPDRVGATTCL